MITPLPTVQEAPRLPQEDLRKARRLHRDLKLLVTFVALRCDHCHRGAGKSAPALKTHDVAALAGREVRLCVDCNKLLTHALIKRTHCPHDPKP